MVIDHIVDRESELAALNEVLREKSSRLIGVTGRRRIGKTILLEH